MKAKANLSRTLLVLAVVVLVAMAVALFGLGLRTAETQTTTSASTTTYYTVQDLGTLPGATYSPPTSVPYSINDSGHVVGYADVSVGSGYYFGYYEYAIGHAFLYDGAMKDLGTLGGGFSSGATAINSSGQAVGNSVDGSWMSHAFLYKDGVMKELSTLGAIMSSSGIEPGPDSQAFGINDSGQVVGLFQVYGTDYYANNYHAYLYDSESATPKMKDLGLLGGTYPSYYSNSQANGINNKGQVVGWSAYDDIGHVHAFLYKDGKMQDLGDLNPRGGTNSYAYGINTSGQVVGQAQYVDGGAWHAYLYDETATPKMTDLGTLGGGGNSSAYAINDSGQVVGFSSLSSGGSSWYAFLYDKDKGMIDLGTLTHPDNNGNVWTLGNARDINNNGQIVADGSRINANGTTVYSALLLTPTSAPPPAYTPPSADTEAPSAPTISNPQNNSLIPADSYGSFSVSGSAEPGSTVELFEGTTSKDTQKAGYPTGAWSIPLSGVSEGTHTYSAKAKDAAGNTSSASNAVTVTVDIQAPSAPTITGPANNSYDNDGVVTISGTAEAGSTVTVVDDASSPTTKTATADTNTGAWSVTFGSSSSKLSDATYTYSAAAKDAAGNTSSASTRKVTVDKAPPTVTASSVSPTSGATKVARNISVTASFSEKIDPTTLISTPTSSANPNVGTSTTFTLVKSGTTTPIINAKVSYDDSTKKVTLTPSTSLAARTKYTAKLSSGVKDLAGNALTAYTWSFTTGS